MTNEPVHSEGADYGKDDEEAVARIVDLMREALTADARGDEATARAKTNEMVAFAKMSSNLHPFSLLFKPVDWFTAARSWGKDAPERAVSTMLHVTKLGKYY